MADRVDPDKAATSDRDIYEEARDRLDTCTRAESKNRQKAKADILFREGDQWDTDKAVTITTSQQKPELVINFTDALCQRVENNLRDECPRGGAHPIGDGADVDITEVIEGIGRHVEHRSSAADVAYQVAGRSAVTAGEGYFRLLSEWEHAKSFQKELRIAPIRNIFTVYMDPNAVMPAGEDSRWVIITTKMPRPEYKRRYPRASNKDFSAGGGYDRKDRDWEDKNTIRLAEYFRIIDMPDTVHLLRHPTGVTVTRLGSELTGGMGDFKEVDKRPTLRQEVQWFRLNGKTIIERAVMPGSWIPVFRVEGNRTDVDGETIRRGMVRFQRDPQRMMNYGETAQTMRLGLATKASWVMAEGQMDGHKEWEDSNVVSYPVLTYKPVTISTAQGDVLLPPPQRVEVPQVEAGFAALTASMRSNLLMVSGMPNDPGQDQRGAAVSGIALQRRDKMQDKSHLQYSANLKLAIAQCWRVMLDWIPATYKEPGRVQRIIGEDTVAKTVKLNQPTQEQGPDGNPITKVLNDLSVGRYDVAMEAGPGYETRREEGAEALISLLAIQPLAELIAQHGADLVFRSLDHPYMQELADRLAALTPDGLKEALESLPKQAQSIVKALMQQVQALKQQLQAVEQDRKAGITKAHLQATERAHATEENNATKRADVESRERTEIQRALIDRHTKLDVAEINVGGKLLDTHVAGGYEAQRLIHEAEQAEKSNGAGQ